MTQYTFSLTTFNNEHQNYQTGVNINGETVCFITGKTNAESHTRARVAGMLMAIDESQEKRKSDTQRKWNFSRLVAR